MELEKIVLLKLNDKRDVFTTVPKSMQNEVSKSIGSEFAKGSRDTIRGLTHLQERVYLPNILGVQTNDPNFPLKAKDFWSDFTITPTVEGLRLNIATTKSKVSTKVTKEGIEVDEIIEIDTPVDWDSYIVYNFAMKSSRVAKTKEERTNIGMYDFYLVDLAEEQDKKVSDFEVKDKADGIYVRLTIDTKWEQNEDKINWILEVMKDKKKFIDVESMDKTEKKMSLSQHKETNPREFISVVEDDNLEHKAFLNKCLSNRVILKEGNNYFNQDENIGSDATVSSWFKSPVNSAKVLQLKSRLDKVIQDKRQ